MKIIYKPEPKPIEIRNPYKNLVFTCDCGIKFLVEDEDILNLETKSIMQVDKYWYEHNMDRCGKVHFIKCECGNLVQLDEVIRGYSWAEGKIQIGGNGKPYKDNE